MNRTTNVFVIAACSVIIGWGGITAYNYFQNEYRQNALEKCTKNEEYAGLERLSEGSVNANFWSEEARKYLNKCLEKHGLALKD